jgi:hypothetical protein
MPVKCADRWIFIAGHVIARAAKQLLRFTGGLPGAYQIACFAACSIGCGAGASQTGKPELVITTYRGQGFVMSYPAYWTREISDKAVSLKVPTEAGQIFFSIGPVAPTRDQAFNAVRAGYPTLTFSSPEPTLYGAWRGDSITSYFNVNGQAEVMSMTAIEANNTFYALIMIAPLKVSWDAFKLREALGNTLTFNRLPAQSRGSGSPCSSCGAMLSSTMNTLTTQTLNMMR